MGGSSSTSCRAKQPAWVTGAVSHLHDHLPGPLRRELGDALDDLRESSSAYSTLFNGRRNGMWTDIIDPELCLTWSSDGQVPTSFTPNETREAESRPRRVGRFPDSDSDSSEDILEPEEQLWLPAEAEADVNGCVQWRSWLNHLCPKSHAALLSHLAVLVELALPHWELLLGVSLRCRPLQLVVGAYEHRLNDDLNDTPHSVSDWHIDGHEAENIIATATNYLEISGDLSGGALVFATQEDMLDEEPQQQHTEQPVSGSVIVFNNTKLRHRVTEISGAGRRLLVALHLVDPDVPRAPSAASLPRQLDIQAKKDTLNELKFAIRCRFPQFVFPWHIYELIWDFTGFGLNLRDLRKIRECSRIRRLVPGGMVHHRGGTGTFSRPSGPVLGGTGSAQHDPYDLRTCPDGSDD